MKKHAKKPKSEMFMNYIHVLLYLVLVTVQIGWSKNCSADTLTYSPRVLFAFGREGPGSGQFRSNYGIAIDKKNGWVYVTDTGYLDKSVKPAVNRHPGENHRIEKFDLNGNFIMAWGEFGGGPGQFKRPLSLAVDDEDYVYVGEEAGGRIQKFDPQGNFILQWGTKGKGEGQFNNPYDILFHDGYIYVADRVNGNIQKFTTSGVFIESFANTGGEPEKLNLPVAVEVDEFGNFYVADIKAAPGDRQGYTFSAVDRIVKYAPDYTYILDWGKYGTGNYEFDYPRAICIDDFGSLFISDRNNNRIQIFDVNGAFLGSFGQKGRAIGQFRLNRQLDVIGHHLYVADAGNSRVQVFGITPISSPWSMFRHDAFHTGRSPYRGPASPNLKWKYKSKARIWPSPSISADETTVYMAGQDTFLTAFNVVDGAIKWKFKAGGMIFSSPAVGRDGTIYIGSDDTFLHAISPDGIEKWAFKTGDKILSQPTISHDGETIYIGSNDDHIYALDLMGNMKWKYYTGKHVPGSPAVDLDGKIYVASGVTLFALNPDGTLYWKFKTTGWIGASPAIDSQDSTVYIGSWDGTFYSLRPDGALKWKLETGGRVESSAAISLDRTVYVGSVDEYLYALTPDGEIKWKFHTAGCPECTCHIKLPLHPNCNEIEGSPAVDADGTIYIGSHDNFLYAINPDGTLKWKFQAGDWINSSPAIGSDGTIYFGSRDKNFYALGP